MTIHSEHPFADAQRRAERQFRGRLGGRVSLWTTGDLDSGGPDLARVLSLDAQVRTAERADHPVRVRPVGLAVTSMIAVDGPQWHLVAAIDPDSDLGERLTVGSGAVVSLLSWPHRGLAEVFAGLAPSPGGPFRAAEFEQTPWGPRLIDAPTWAGVRVVQLAELGWSVLVTAVVDEAWAGTDESPLHHVRGAYSRG